MLWRKDPHWHRPAAGLSPLPGLGWQVCVFKFAVSFYRSGAVTAGMDSTYYYTRYFGNIEKARSAPPAYVPCPLCSGLHVSASARANYANDVTSNRRRRPRPAALVLRRLMGHPPAGPFPHTVIGLRLHKASLFLLRALGA